MTFTGRVTLGEEEIKALIVAEIDRRLGIKIETQEIWLGLVARGDQACQANIDLKDREIAVLQARTFP